MELRPILSTLRRHKTAAALIVLEIALSCAIICNAIFVIAERVARIQRDSGLAEDQLVLISVSNLNDHQDGVARMRADLAALRAIPGVRAATSINQIPYGNSAWNISVNLKAEQRTPNFHASAFLGDEEMLETFGLRLVEGRDFNADEYIDATALSRPGGDIAIPAAIVTRAFADKLYPGELAVGKTFRSLGNSPIRIVGVIESVLRPNESPDASENAYAMLLPVRMTDGIYLLRADPEIRAEVLSAAADALSRLDAGRIFNVQRTLLEMREDYYARDRAVVWLLLVVCGALLVITAFGIGGLASFWVQQRTKQIGVRRALGATRGQILRYFQVENFLLASAGIVLGMIGAYGINQWLVAHYVLSRLPAAYLPIGALALWLLGQAAVIGPARRAASVPPALATRSV